ncbi:MAG: hypothetical protein QME52_11435 [Bacteroidota bacterium]|nr:hypothetical protein [Bacteroidota bacterium]
MQSAKSQYAYFESLEKAVKIALLAYIMIFLCSNIIIIVGGETIINLFYSPQLIVIIAIVICIIGLLIGLIYGISKINWLGELHVWLDNKIFGFLNKSNEIIFQEISLALEPEERKRISNMGKKNRSVLAKSVFSQLANDDNLFAALLQSDIFRFWILYWIMLYGTFVFTILSTETFISLLIGSNTGSKLLFTIFWSLSLAHLSLSLMLGHKLLKMTKKTVENIVHSHQEDIASILKNSMDEIATL